MLLYKNIAFIFLYVASLFYPSLSSSLFKSDRSAGGEVILTEKVLLSTSKYAPNTIFVVSNHLSLNNQEIIFPKESSLVFRGGSLTSGVIVGNDTKIFGDIALYCDCRGSFDCATTKLEWFVSRHSGDQTDAFRHAISFCSGTKTKILDGEMMPININSTIVFTENEDLYLRNLNLTFTPDSNEQSMFVFDSHTKYGGGNKYIRDCIFRCNNPKEKYQNVCCLFYKQWYNTSGFIMDNVRINGFTGYAIVNTSYLQESTFSNVICHNVGGLITYNSNQVYGEQRGSSNIVCFSNCSINNSIIGSNPKLYALIDLYNCGEMRFSNLVMQGTSNNQRQKAMAVNGRGFSVPTTLTIDGGWLEFIGKPTDDNYTVDINTPCHLVLARRCPLYFNINSDAVVVDFKVSNIESASNALDQIRIKEGKKVLLRFDSHFYKPFDLQKIHDYMSQGYIIEFRNSYQPWSGSSNSMSVVLESQFHFDGLKSMIERMKGSSYRGLRTYMTNESGCNVLVFEDARGTNRNIIYPTALPLFSELDNSVKTIIRDCLIRITVLEDVTSRNVKDVSASSPFYSLYYSQQCASEEPLNIKVGDKAGKTTGWVRYSDVTEATKAWLESQVFANAKNVRVEIAKLDYYRMQAKFDENITVNSSGKLKVINTQVPHYVLSNVTEMNKSIYDFIKGATAYWHLGNNIYYSYKGEVVKITGDRIVF